MTPMMQTTSNHVIITLKDIKREYNLGVECIHALDGVSLELRDVSFKIIRQVVVE